MAELDGQGIECMGTQSASGRPAKPLLVGSTPTPCSRFDEFSESPNKVRTGEGPLQGNVQDAGEPKAKPVGREQQYRALLEEIVENWWMLDCDFNDKESHEWLDRVKKALED